MISHPRSFHAYWRLILTEGCTGRSIPLSGGGPRDATVARSQQGGRPPDSAGSVIAGSGHGANPGPRGVGSGPLIRGKYENRGLVSSGFPEARGAISAGQRPTRAPGVPRSLAEPHHSTVLRPIYRSNPETSPISPGCGSATQTTTWTRES